MRVRATAPPHRPPGLGSLRGLGLVYFLYLFLFSGLEFTLSFLVHQRFQFSRWDAPHPGGSPSRHTRPPGPAQGPGADCAAPRGRGPRSPRLPGRVRAAPAGQGCSRLAPCRVEQGKMFFFIGLTMATIQGAYARRIRPGREIAAVKQVWSSPGLGGRRCPRSAEAAGALRPAVPPTGHLAAHPRFPLRRLGTHAAHPGLGAAPLFLG